MPFRYAFATTLLVVIAVVLALHDETRIYVVGAFALVMAGVLVAYPRLLAVLAVLSVLFAQTIEHFGSQLTVVDDAMVILAVVALPIRALVTRRYLRGFPLSISMFALIYLALGIISGMVHNVPLETAAAGGYLAARPFLLAWALLQVDWDRQIGERIGRLGVWLLWIIIGSGLVNLVIPTQWTAIFASNPVPEYNGFVPGIVGVFAHPSFFGQVLALGVVVLLAYRINLGRRHNLLIGVAAVFSLLSFRRKTLASLPAGIVQTLVAKRPVATIVMVVLLVPVIVVVALPQFTSLWTGIERTYFTDPDQNARSALTINSLGVANQYAPWGAGFGRYGSSVAATNYSPEYYRLGLNTIYGMEPTDPKFASDTFWPQVLGESGWLGALAFIGMLISAYLYFLRVSRKTDPFYRVLGAAGAGWLILLTVESVASPSFSAPPTFALLPMILAYTEVVMRQTNKSLGESDLPVDVLVEQVPEGLRPTGVARLRAERTQ